MYTYNNINIEKGEGYYNISTKRRVNDTTRKDLIFLDLGEIKVCGKSEDILKFKEENLIYEPRQERKINIWKCLFSCFYDSTDVENFEDIENLTTYGLNNISGKGKIVRIIDGDTFEILVYIKLKDLTNEFKTGRQKLIKSPIKTKYVDAGFFTIYKVRIMGSDAAEHDTYHGQQATEQMKLYFEKNNNIVWYHIPENNYKRPDPHNRILMWLYLDRDHKQNATEYLLSLKFLSNDPNLSKWNGTPLAKRYDGGKKDDYMKSLPKLKN